MTRMFMPCAMAAKRRPMAPSPIKPMVLPSSSRLLCVDLSQWPSRMRASSDTSDLAQPNSSASACSATAAALAPAAATTSMPRCVAAALSMVSVPLPCLEITRKDGAASIAAAPTLL
ncbi:hypothetical protein D3C77_556600 [compost metagenome]